MAASRRGQQAKHGTELQAQMNLGHEALAQNPRISQAMRVDLVLLHEQAKFPTGRSVHVPSPQRLLWRFASSIGRRSCGGQRGNGGLG